MNLRQLGRTDLRISAFGMGCGNFGGIGSAPEFFGQGESEDEAFALLDRAVDLGINYLDTADAYGGGRSETTIGKWLGTKSSSVRDGLLISSKVGNAVGEKLDKFGLSRNHVLRQVDASLGRLGVDHLDMYLVHEIDDATPLAETVGVFNEVVNAGKVRFVGISNHSASRVEEALSISDAGHLTRFEWIQNSFNLIDQGDQRQVLVLCRDKELGLTPFSPLCGGMLSGKYSFDADYPGGSRMTLRPEPYLRYWNQSTFAAIDRLAEMAADRGVSTAGLALAWLAHHPDVTSSIVGPRKGHHFDAVVQAMELELTRDEWRDLGALFVSENG